MAVAFIALGSNLGDREANLRAALDAVGRAGRVTDVSSLYETDPVGPEQPLFYNAVCRIETELEPDTLLTALKAIEADLGRDPAGERWGPRVIDLDILMYGELTVDQPWLRIPHPRLSERAFVLVPFAEIAPDVDVPGMGRVRELAEAAGEAGVRLVKGQGWESEPVPDPGS